MDGRLILMLMLLISGPTKFAFSLHCYTCYDSYTCETPDLVYCDSLSANSTREKFEHMFTDVKILNPTDFSCFVGDYSVGHTKKRSVSGCIVTGTVDCNHQSQSKVECSICGWQLCNSAAANALSYVALFTAFFFCKILNRLKV